MRITNHEIYEKLLELKHDVVDLKDHVNHRMSLMEANLLELRTALGNKADRSELLTSVMFRMLKQPLARAILAATLALVSLIASSPRWLPLIKGLLINYSSQHPFI